MKTPPSQTILLDTNFILAHAEMEGFIRELRNSRTEQVTLATTDGVALELERLARSGKPPAKVQARIGLSLLENQDVEVRETNPATPNVDMGLLLAALGSKETVKIATIDRVLRESLSRLGISVIIPRNKGGFVARPAASGP